MTREKARQKFAQEVYDYVQFAKWVATEIFSKDWDDNNKDGFTEIACRKLAKLGLVRANGDEWELGRTVESEDKE